LACRLHAMLFGSKKKKEDSQSDSQQKNNDADQHLDAATQQLAATTVTPAEGSAGPVDISEPADSQPNLLLCPPAFDSVDGKPKCGFTTVGKPGLQLVDGDGTGFELRIGPDYKKHGKKAASLSHTYAPITMDIFKCTKATFNLATKLTLPPPPGGADTPNTTGLPRRLIVNCIIPADAPPMLGGGGDGNCYQVFIVFGATTEKLAAWKAGGSAACELFSRFNEHAPLGQLPTSGDLDIKERLKVLPKLDNMNSLGLPGWLTGYNGKPALVTKSGSIYRGDDYLELGMNTFRFGFLTKKGMNYLLPRFAEFDFHAAMTVEGRDDSELPEQTLCATRIRGVDITKIAVSHDFGE